METKTFRGWLINDKFRGKRVFLRDLPEDEIERCAEEYSVYKNRPPQQSELLSEEKLRKILENFAEDVTETDDDGRHYNFGDKQVTECLEKILQLAVPTSSDKLSEDKLRETLTLIFTDFATTKTRTLGSAINLSVSEILKLDKEGGNERLTVSELKTLFEKYGLTRHFNLISEIIDLQKSKPSPSLTPEQLAEMLPSKRLIEITDEHAIEVVNIIHSKKSNPTKRIIRRRHNLIDVSIMGGSKFEMYISINSANAEIYMSTGVGKNSVSNLPKAYDYLKQNGYDIYWKFNGSAPKP